MREVPTSGRPAKSLGFRTDDLDEAVDFVVRNFGPHDRVPHARGPLGYSLAVSSSARVVSGTTSSSIASTVRAAVARATLHLPSTIGAEYRVGRQLLRSAPDVAVLLAPGHDYTVRVPPGVSVGFTIDLPLLEAELEAHRRRGRRNWALRSMELPLSAEQSAALRALLRRHGRAASGAEQPGVGEEVAAVEQDIARWLAAGIAGFGGVAGLSLSSRLAVEHLEAWISSNAAQPLTLEKLSEIAGVSPRILQDACKARWGQSPVELVTSRRLQLARSLLVSAGVPSVTEVAERSGFTHFGRFSVLYRRTYGESPSSTLREKSGIHRTARDPASRR